MFGQDITFVTWDIPKFEAEAKSPELYIGTIPIGPIPVNLNVGLLFRIAANISVGFDSRGLRSNHSFLDGIFFFDRGSNSTPVVSVGVGVFANATVGVPVIGNAGIEGQLVANLDAYWNNNDGDDKYHLDELLDNFLVGPQCVFDLGGRLTAQLFFQAECFWNQFYDSGDTGSHAVRLGYLLVFAIGSTCSGAHRYRWQSRIGYQWPGDSGWNADRAHRRLCTYARPWQESG